MLGDVLHMLSTYERKGTIDGPLAIALYHGCERIIHKHIDATASPRRRPDFFDELNEFEEQEED